MSTRLPTTNMVWHERSWKYNQAQMLFIYTGFFSPGLQTDSPPSAARSPFSSQTPILKAPMPLGAQGSVCPRTRVQRSRK